MHIKKIIYWIVSLFQSNFKRYNTTVDYFTLTSWQKNYGTVIIFVLTNADYAECLRFSKLSWKSIYFYGDFSFTCWLKYIIRIF